jgi:hypothetical protein
MKIGDRLVSGFEQHAVGVEEFEREGNDGVGNNVHRFSKRLKGIGIDAAGARSRRREGPPSLAAL